MNERSNHFNYSPLASLRTYTERLFQNQSIKVDFPPEITSLTEKNLKAEPCSNRIDLRPLPCFTIDCNDTKDIDDAISLIKTLTGYKLGVHIADVAAYITPDSALDVEAFDRGTSIYLPHLTIPMLPAVLSNNLCSLNPDTDRNSLSVLIDLDLIGSVKNYEIKKSIIHSRIKGTYSEVNDILENNCTPETAYKYADFTKTLFDMKELADKLHATRVQHGANVSTTAKPHISIVNGEIELIPYSRSSAESLIEEFMILANRLVAQYFLDQNLPIVYRAQKQRNTLATYTTEECRHAELSLLHYAHFTSPIRRLADLKIHQVLTAHLNGIHAEELHDLFDEKLKEAAEQAKKKKNRADNIQKACTKFCYAHFFNNHCSETFTGKVVGCGTWRNRAIIELGHYHILLPAAVGIRASYTGRQVSFKIRADTQNNNFEAINIQRLSRSAS